MANQKKRSNQKPATAKERKQIRESLGFKQLRTPLPKDLTSSQYRKELTKAVRKTVSRRRVGPEGSKSYTYGSTPKSLMSRFSTRQLRRSYKDQEDDLAKVVDDLYVQGVKRDLDEAITENIIQLQRMQLSGQASTSQYKTTYTNFWDLVKTSYRGDYSEELGRYKTVEEQYPTPESMREFKRQLFGSP